MAEQLIPSGALVVVAGSVIGEDGVSRPGISVNLQGDCAGMEATREGLLQAQRLLLEAVGLLGNLMLTAPAKGEPGPRLVVPCGIVVPRTFGQ